MEKIIKNLQKHLSISGFKSAVISIHRLTDLQLEIENLLKHNILNKDFYNERLSQFNFQPPKSLHTTELIVITAAR